MQDFRVELTVEWLPANIVPRPLSVLPVTLVVIHSMFDESRFDLDMPGTKHGGPR